MELLVMLLIIFGGIGYMIFRGIRDLIIPYIKSYKGSPGNPPIKDGSFTFISVIIVYLILFGVFGATKDNMPVWLFYPLCIALLIPLFAFLLFIIKEFFKWAAGSIEASSTTPTDEEIYECARTVADSTYDREFFDSRLKDIVMTKDAGTWKDPRIFRR